MSHAEMVLWAATVFLGVGGLSIVYWIDRDEKLEEKHLNDLRKKRQQRYKNRAVRSYPKAARKGHTLIS